MPIENLINVDILGAWKDGKGVDLIIVTSRHLDSSATTQELLLDKIENYLRYINSEEFENEFGKLDPENIVIKINCVDEPDSIIKELLKKINLWVIANNARIEMIIK